MKACPCVFMRCPIRNMATATGMMQTSPSFQSNAKIRMTAVSGTRTEPAQVGHLVGQKRVGDTGIIVDDLTNLAAGIEVEESEGHADDLSHASFRKLDSTRNAARWEHINAK